MSNIELLQRRLEREKQARKQAEALLEAKSLELFTANQQQQKTYEELQAFTIERERTLEALQESEGRFRSVMQSANDAIIIGDCHGNIVAWNKGG